MTFKLEGRQIVRHVDGGIDRVIAEVSSNGDLEDALRLVSQANLADRDEQLLDRLGETITTRNDT